ncbi:MAG: Lrp/AsnC family transcriptional regulator [Clostridia bacterium]|nr:Lrp/AsnC family transcriptional regulator [Clostridia bacterium]MDY5264919.1 Lrp/AsnC family transcriptional regulator [Eubacteriales bacterium]MDY5440597.1 Lrp/AsnC family transcriptional regulator [Eubacteriales bacterium]
MELDEINVKILNCLRENSRENASVISEKVGLSVSAVIERIKKLEANELIKKYTVVLDKNKIGRDVTALMQVTLDHPKYTENFISKVKSNNDVLECHYLAGNYDFLIKICTNSTESLEKILNKIKAIEGVSKTTTMIVLSTVKNEYSVLL